jgi:hypothetical protein
MLWPRREDWSMGMAKVQVSATCFGQACFDRNDATLSHAQLDAVGRAFIVAANLLKARGYGEVIAVDRDGEELAAILLDHPNTPFPDNGLPRLATVRVGRVAIQYAREKKHA